MGAPGRGVGCGVQGARTAFLLWAPPHALAHALGLAASFLACRLLWHLGPLGTPGPLPNRPSPPLGFPMCGGSHGGLCGSPNQTCSLKGSLRPGRRVCRGGAAAERAVGPARLWGCRGAGVGTRRGRRGHRCVLHAEAQVTGPHGLLVAEAWDGMGSGSGVVARRGGRATGAWRRGWEGAGCQRTPGPTGTCSCVP